jgi:aminoglycoside phosphotransferase family enzyme/predicted kinase
MRIENVSADGFSNQLLQFTESMPGWFSHAIMGGMPPSPKQSEAHESALLNRLLSPAAYPHPVQYVKLIETHISWVFLTGDYVYKVKKPVNFGFLDFSSLERRRHFCEEEVRLNRRFAPAFYLDAVPIVGPPAAARILGQGEVGGAVEPIEWAVRLKQFDEAGRLDRLLDGGGLSAQGCEELAGEMARIQDRLEIADETTPWGTTEAVASAIDSTLGRLREHRPEIRERVGSLELAVHRRLAACSGAIEARRRSGRVRQCHGDLHLANIVRYEGRFVPFDSIEFSDALRWIDVASDVAFLAMDLESRGRGDLAATFTSSWIEAADDHQAACVLPVYLIYRAMVRATVAAIRSAQAKVGPHADPAAAAAANAESDRYLALAERLLVNRRPLLVATSGVSGSGKTTVAGEVAAALGAVRLRSDVERKRIAGMAATDRPRDAVQEAAIYSPESTRRTYARLAELARLILAAGTSVVVDAACNRRWERRILTDAAREAGVPMVWLSLEVPEAVAVARVAARQAVGTDASDASVDIVRAQCAAREPIQPDECTRTSNGEPQESLMPIKGSDLENPEFVRRLSADLLARSGS